MIKWQWASFDQLTTDVLYKIMKARIEVFVVEQNCPYQEADDLDKCSWHLIGWKNREIVSYLRVIFPGKKYIEPSIGRVLTVQHVRRTGIGKELTKEAIKRVGEVYPDTPVRISAQRYLEKFYSEFGFEPVSEPYEEDGIPHIEMLRKGCIVKQ